MRWVLIVSGALILLAVWVAAIWFPELTGIAEAVTAAVLLLVLLVVLVRWLRARMKAAAIEREIVQQASPDTASPDRRPEIIALRAEMHRAVEALKRPRHGLPGGRAVLYSLPWYVIVGPPAVGKTTALTHSGLSFVPSTAGDPKIRGSSGTRNCDWWFSHDAILLDTAGRFAIHDQDRDEWMAFLDALHRLRPERPLDGLIVAVSMTEILSSSDRELDELAGKLRARLDEVLQRLEMVLPVYLLLTKADLIAGFVEFWADLPKLQRSQPWGASFEFDDARLAEPARAIEAEFDALEQVLHARLLDRLPRERSPERRKRVMQFPIELRALRSPLSHFVAALCRPGADDAKPVFRGFYLTSGTQVGRPVERVLQGMLSAFNLNVGSAIPPVDGEVQSYFLTDVFRSVILPDRHLAARSVAGVRRRSRRELTAALAAIGVVGFLLLPALVSYIRNTQLATRAVDSANGTASMSGAGGVPGTKGDPVEQMLDTLDSMGDEASGFAIPGWFGPRAARELREPLLKVYRERVRHGLEMTVRPKIEHDIDSISSARLLADVPATPEDRTPLRDSYEAVKLYAMLVEPKGHLGMARSWAAGRIANLWSAAIRTPDAVGIDRLTRHVSNYLDALETTPQLAWSAIPSLPRARECLKRSQISGLPYRRALLWAGRPPAVRPKDMFDPASLEFVTCSQDCRIQGEYTANGWKQIEPHLAPTKPLPPQASIDQWVIGDASIPADEDGIREDIENRYYRDYSEQWLGFLDALTVRRPSSDVSQARREIAALKKPDGFYTVLFSQLRTNRIRKEPPPLPAGVASAWNEVRRGCQAPWSKQDLDASPSVSGATTTSFTPVEKTFHPFLAFSGMEGEKPVAGEAPPLDSYLKLLERLNATLESSDKLPPSELETQLSEERTAVENLLYGVDGSAKNTLRHLLMPPIEGSVSIGKTTGVGTLSKDWKVIVWKAWQEKLADRSPFKNGARSGVDIVDFDKFFHPGTGSLWAFVKARLAEWVEQGGDGAYVFKRGADPLGGDVLSCLNVAQEITDAFFPDVGEPGMAFSARAEWSAADVTEAKFVVASKATPIGGDQWSTIKWFGEDVSLEWVQRSGPVKWFGERKAFALFDLFKKLGGLTPVAGGGDRPTYVVDAPPLTLKLRGAPLRPDFFSRLHCPSEIQMAAPQ